MIKRCALVICLLCLLAISSVSAEVTSIGAEIITADFEDVSINLSIPRVNGLSDWLYEEYLNTSWRLEHLQFAKYIKEMAVEGRAAWEESGRVFPFFPYQCITEFEVKYNQDQLLSLIWLFYQYTGGAHGGIVQKSINLDLNANKPLKLEDVVLHENALEIILAEINRQIAENPEWYFQDQLPVAFINEEDFYITDAGLVIFYQQYDIAPYATGICEFVIPWHLFD